MKAMAFMLGLILITGLGEKQVRSTVVNSQTGEGIPYVNIKVKGKTMGTSATINGDFSLTGLEDFYEVIFSAVGYRSQTLEVGLIGSKVYLEPTVVTLTEVSVDSERPRQEITVGEVHKKLPSAYGNGSNPRLVARFFKWDTAYNHTPYIKSIKLFTISKVKTARFNIRLYKATEEGEPGEYLYHENIISVAKKGKEITEIDLSDRFIAFPPEGMFVCFECLMIDENKREYYYRTDESNERQLGVNYYPSIGAEWIEGNDLTRINIRGAWMKGSLFVEGKFLEPAFELVLSN